MLTALQVTIQFYHFHVSVSAYRVGTSVTTDHPNLPVPCFPSNLWFLGQTLCVNKVLQLSSKFMFSDCACVCIVTRAG